MGVSTISQSRSWELRLPALPASIVFPAFLMLAGGLMTAHAAVDPDLGVHIRTGAEIVARHAIPSSDTFSLTLQGAPWADFEWLWEVGLAAILSTTGLTGLILVNALLVSVGSGLIYLRLRLTGASPLAGFIAGGLAVLNLWPYSDVRPGMVGFLFASLFLAVLELARTRNNWRWLLALLPAELVWANAHGSYAIGPLLCAVYGLAAAWEASEPAGFRAGLGRAIRVLAGWAGLCVALLAVSVANPLGLGLLRFTLFASHLSFNRQYIGEWRAPDMNQPAFVPLMLTLLISLALPLFAPRVRVAKREALLLTACTIAALQSVQFMPLFAAGAAPVAGLILAALASRRPLLTVRGPLVLAMGFCLLGLGSYALHGAAPDPAEQAMAEHYPVAAVQFIEAETIPGPMFNEFAWGAYLITTLPRLPVFVDGRAEMYGDNFLAAYQDVVTGLADPEPLLDRYGVNLVLIRERSPMATVMDREPGWRRVYKDGMAIVFTRDTWSQAA